MTGDVLDCTWVAYANKGERVSNEYHNTMLPIEPRSNFASEPNL